MNQDLRNILEIAVHAPSGHNYQPWQFLIQGNTIHIHNIPERDTTLFNFRQRGSFIAHGALIENIIIAARTHGYAAQVKLFPDLHNPNLIASVVFEPTPSKTNEPLYEYIRTRSTNRKPYKVLPLQKHHREDLLKTPTEVADGEIRLIEDRTLLESLAEILTLNEMLVLQNFHMHQSLFPHILWNAKEDQERKLGLYLKTFELPPPGRVMFRLLQHWPITKQLAKLGLPKIVAKQNKKLYASSSAIGVILLKDEANQDFITGGRIMQRMWLKSTKNGLSVQPVTGLLYLAQRVLSDDQKYFTNKEKKLIIDAYERIKNVFQIKNEVMMMIFRIGYGDQPSARAQKLAPQFIETT